MSLDKMPAHARCGADGALEVYRGGLGKGAEVGAAEGFGRYADDEVGGGKGGYGQTGSWVERCISSGTYFG